MSTGRVPADTVGKYVYEYPEEKSHEFNTAFASETDNLTVGDLHGNPIKLIHILIDKGIVDLPGETLEVRKQQFQYLVNLYQQIPCGMNNNQGEHTPDVQSYHINVIRRFHEILSMLKFCDSPPLLRLLGDMLADRGVNDLFTLYTLMSLHKKGVPFEINLSNHDEAFLHIYFDIIANPLNKFNKNKFGPYAAGLTPANSVDNLGSYLSELVKIDPQAATVHINEIKEIIQTAYLPKLKFINYEYNENTNTFSIFTHAPVGLITIQLLARDLRVPYDDSNVKNLISTIEAINEKIPIILTSDILNKKITTGETIYNRPQPSAPLGRVCDYNNYSMQEIKKMFDDFMEISQARRSPEQEAFLNEHKKTAMFRLIWERVSNKRGNVYDLTDMPKIKNGINFMFIHGHDTPEQPQIGCEHIKCYDGVRGKHSFVMEKYFHDITIASTANNATTSQANASAIMTETATVADAIPPTETPVANAENKTRATAQLTPDEVSAPNTSTIISGVNLDDPLVFDPGSPVNEAETNASSTTQSAPHEAAAIPQLSPDPFDPDATYPVDTWEEDDDDDDVFRYVEPPSISISAPMFVTTELYSSSSSAASTVVTSPYSQEHYIDHGESKGINSSCWPIMKELNKQLSRLHAILEMRKSTPHLFAAEHPEAIKPSDYEIIEANLLKLPKTIAEQYEVHFDTLMTEIRQLNIHHPATAARTDPDPQTNSQDGLKRK